MYSLSYCCLSSVISKASSDNLTPARTFLSTLLTTNTDGADDGIETIEAGGLVLCCLQTRTGVKFVITAEPSTPDLDLILREIYVLYSDCALKDPFYELEMPIRTDLFTSSVDALVERFESRGNKVR